MSDKNTATVRNGWNATVLAAVVWAAARWLNIDIDPTDPMLVLVVGAVATVGYRACLELSARFPVFGRILFGKATPPSY